MSKPLAFKKRPTVLEFFAGVGLARLGLAKAGFETVWANDISVDKQVMYTNNFGGDRGHYALADIATVRGSDLPGGAQVAWASSPCTDLSLAGNRSGLAGRESSAFYEFARILEELGSERPSVVVLENVLGLATSHGGDDLTAAIRTFNALGYSIDVLAIDARRFLPQSRPRLFLVGAQEPPEDDDSESSLRPGWTDAFHADPTLRMHRAPLPELPTFKRTGLGRSLEKLSASDSRWWDPERTQNFISSMSRVQRDRLDEFVSGTKTKYRTAYRRTRGGVAVWEMRPDDISGCLRTARGGSSKQAVVQMGGGQVRVRWMTGLEYASLMGAADYELGGFRDSQIHFAFGDAVAVPAVAWLGEHYLMPLVQGKLAPKRELAVV